MEGNGIDSRLYVPGSDPAAEALVLRELGMPVGEVEKQLALILGQLNRQADLLETHKREFNSFVTDTKVKAAEMTRDLAAVNKEHTEKIDLLTECSKSTGKKLWFIGSSLFLLFAGALITMLLQHLHFF